MSRTNAAQGIESIVDEMRQLTEDEQRVLAAVVLNDRKLEAFVEELEDHLMCEAAEEEGAPEPLKLN